MAWGIIQVVEHLPRKYNFNSTSSSTKNERKWEKGNYQISLEAQLPVHPLMDI
jgi:hypothetical protein